MMTVAPVKMIVNILMAVPNAATSGNQGADAKRRRKSTASAAMPAGLTPALALPPLLLAAAPAGLRSIMKTPSGTATSANAKPIAFGLAMSSFAPITLAGILEHEPHGTHAPPGAMQSLQDLLAHSFPFL